MKKGYMISLVALLEIFIFSFYFINTAGVCITIRNNCDEQLRKIEIVYYGGVDEIMSLKPKESCRLKIKSTTSSSNLKLRWFDMSGQVYYADRIGEFSSSDKSKIYIRLKDQGKLQWGQFNLFLTPWQYLKN
ncbi:MAG: hypothetical protein NT030_08580 [Candidatus Saganbacteria bacterium]|nr:hypothetical protein [Candidatus Saganbacteria bacterium]